MSMERLTEKITNIETGNVLVYRPKRDVSNIEAFRKLGEYEDAEEQGLLVMLPCKVGDILYEASIQWKEVLIRTVAAIVICNNSIWVRNGCGDSFEYGVEIFLTKEEAEAALAEMEK